MLRCNGRYQLVCQLKRSDEGQPQIWVWRFSTRLHLSAIARASVPKLLLPTLILSEADVFPVSEDHDYAEEDGLASWEVPASKFDSDVFYQQV